MIDRYPTHSKIIVRGNGSFPIDMLRYAVATPATEIDAHKYGFHIETRDIVLHRFTRETGGATLRLGTIADRFASYGWHVVDVAPDPVL